jgi:signal transduction histidine kinase
MNPLRQHVPLPVIWRIPVAVAILMIAVSAVTSERVLSRLGTLQATYLQSLATSYLDGVTASISPSVLRQDSWEIFDGLDRMKSETADIVPIETIVTTNTDVILAASDPTARATLGVLDSAFLGNFPVVGVNLDKVSERGYVMRSVVHQGRPIGKIFAVFNAAPLLRERRELLATLLLTNATLTAVLVLVGFLAVRRMMRPIQLLGTHMLEAAEGRPVAISDAEQGKTNKEVRRVFRAFNMLLRSESERQLLARELAKEEKLASLGRLASGMAHEINNPLGGLMNAVDTLRNHGSKASVRRTTLDLLERGLQGIGEVVQAALATYRSERLSRPLSAQDFEDVGLLAGPELRKKNQTLQISFSKFGDLPCVCPSGPVRQALLNLLLNASAATPSGGMISVTATRAGDGLTISIEDQGGGMPQKSQDILTASATGMPPRSTDGLGLWVVRQISDELGATLSVSRTRSHGVNVSLHIPDARPEALVDAA